jgi:hypothetical protein
MQMNKTRIAWLTAILLYSTTCLAQQWGDYTFYSQQNSSTAVLVDTNGSTYHTWTFASNKKTGYSSYLLPGGAIVRTVARQGNSFQGGGMCGEVMKVDYNGNALWDYVYSTTQYCSHHDICPMPDGNVLLIAYELKTAAEVTAAGSKYSHTMWPDKIVEIQPLGASGGTTVWEWHAWDHLVQDYDPTKANYGVVADHPELLDLNYNNTQQNSDWMHVNGIDYNESLDQIVFSSHNLNEFYVIDHSTTTTEAAGHTGGNSGKGGDLLYRWGNPAAYDASGAKIFSVVHDAHWIPVGCPNANYLVGFNNNGVSQNKSSVDLVSPPYNGYNYTYIPGAAYAPSNYTYRHACNGHSNNECNSQQLPNGNMLVCISMAGFIYEVDAANTLLWSKTLSGHTSNAFRYTRCYVEGTIAPAPTITQVEDTLFPSYGATYQWYFEDQPIEGATNSFLVPEQNGFYRVSITNDDGCESELSDPFDYQNNVIVEAWQREDFSLYPNPTDGIIHLKGQALSENNYSLFIFSATGKLINKDSNVTSFDLSTFPNGIYMVILVTEKSERVIRKIVLIR